MTSISVVKLVVSASVLAGASGVALVFALPYLQHEEKRETAPVSALTAPQPPAPPAASEAPPALAATETKDSAAELSAPPPPAPAADPSVPAFDLARIETGGDAVIAGTAAPGATVELLRNGEHLDQAVADASGQFVIVPSRLPVGDYELTLRAKSPDGTVALSKQSVAVTVEAVTASLQAVPPHAVQPAETTSSVSQPSISQPLQAMATSLVPEQGSRAAEAAAKPEAAPKTSTKIVVRGDSLWRISRITYGAGEQYAILYKANRDRIRNPNIIHPGQVLVLPSKQH
jgi:nucleoid-associated protein YgaU